MSQRDILELLRVLAVIGLVVAAAAVATPKGRLPLVMRGLLKVMRKTGAAPAAEAREAQPVSLARRLGAFALIVLAAALALARLG